MRRIKRAFALFLILALGTALFCSSAAAEDTSASTMRLESAEGTVTVKNASGLSVQFKEKMRLYDGYSVKTESGSYAYISLDGSKTMKLDASSEASISKTGKKLEIALVSGSLFFDVSKPLQSDERMSIRTSTMVTGIRGTSACVSTPDRYHSEIALLSGQLEVVGCAPGPAETLTLNAGECVVVAQEAAGTAQMTMETTPVQAEALPGFVAVEVARDPELQSRIAAETELSVPDLIADAEARLAADEAAAQQAETAVQQQMTQQSSVTSLFDAPAGGDSTSDSSSDSDDQSSSPSTPADPDPGTSTDPAPVTPTDPDPGAHTVTISGSNFTALPGTSNTVTHGGNFFFKLTPGAGYEITSVTCGGETLTADAATGEYTVGPVTADMTVTVTAALATRTVTISGSNFTASPSASNTVTHGENFSFKLTPSAGYEIISVTCGGETLTAGAADGEYTVGPVTADMTIAVTTELRHTVRFSGENFSASPAMSYSVGDGQNYFFKLTPHPGYAITSVTCDGQTLTPDATTGECSVGPVTADMTILVTTESTTKDLTDPGLDELKAALENDILTTVNVALSNELIVTAPQGSEFVIPAGKTLNLNSGALSFQQAVSLNGALTADTGTTLTTKYSSDNSNDGYVTVNSGGKLTVKGRLEIQSGQLLNNGTLEIPGIAQIHAGQTLTNNAVMAVSGELTANGSLTNSGSGTLTVDSDGKLIIDNSNDTYNYGTLNNNGTITIESSRRLVIDQGSTLTNSNTLTVKSSGTLSVYNGTLAVTGGSVGTDSSYDSSAELTIGGNGTMELAGGVLRAAQITGSGAFTWTGGTIECTEASGTPVGSGVTLTPAAVGTPTAITGQTGWYSWPLS